MNRDFARFLPPSRQAAVSTPAATWWDWQGRRVHILRARNAQAGVRLLGVHGAGGHAGALWPFVSVTAGVNAEVLIADLPLYGRTHEPDPSKVRYETWIDMLSDLVMAERRADDRPLVLVGASMGGLLAYEVAARTKQVAAVLATCLLDPSDSDARAAAARFSGLGRAAPSKAGPLGRIRIPIRWLIDIDRMSRNPELSRLCATDPLGGGVRVPLGFLTSFLGFKHTPPEQFDAAPVVLAHPAADAWTRPQLSIRFLDRIAGPTSLVLLDGCGHFPIEEPGLTQLADTVRSVCEAVIGATMTS